MAPPIQPLFDSRVRRQQPLARFTTFRIGGPADWLVVIDSVEDAAAALRWAAHRGLETHLLGSGSNVLAADAGARGLTIVNRASSAQQLQRLSRVMPRVDAEQGVLLELPASTPLAKLAWWTIEQGLAGLEWAVGIPGTIGGAVVGNAGAHGGCIADCLESVRLLGPDYATSVVKAQILGLHYRGSLVKTMLARSSIYGIITGASLRLRIAKRSDLQGLATGFLSLRRQTQPMGWSAGSVFANPPGQAAGRLLDLAGLKGQRQGGAHVSAKHANFIINRGGATASDVEALMAVCRQRVLDQFGVKLMPEIAPFGNWDHHRTVWAPRTRPRPGSEDS